MPFKPPQKLYCGQQESNPGSPCHAKSQTTTTQILSRKSRITFIWWIVERFLVHWPHQKEPSGSVQENLTKEGKWLNVQTTSFPSSVQVVKCKDERWLSVDFRSDFARMTMTFCSFTAPFKMPNGKSDDTLFPLCGNRFLMAKFFQWPMTSTFAALRQSLLKQMRVTEEEIYCKESRTSFGSVNFSH